MSKPVSLLAPGILTASRVARVSLAAPTGRLVLRSRDPAALNGAFGLELPSKIGQRVIGDVQVMKLGPDEWTIQTPDVSGLVDAAAGVYASHPHSLVDVTGREITLLIEGERAADLLTLGMARDIDSVPVGEGRRTICDGVTVVLWRDAPDAFRMDVWHSFVPHLLHLFEVGCRELAAETL